LSKKLKTLIYQNKLITFIYNTKVQKGTYTKLDHS